MSGILVEIESWFLVQWPRGECPRVIAEFHSRTEAEEALAVRLGDVAMRIELGLRWLQLTLRSSRSMLEHAELREALAEWDRSIGHWRTWKQRGRASDVVPDEAR